MHISTFWIVHVLGCIVSSGEVFTAHGLLTSCGCLSPYQSHCCYCYCYCYCCVRIMMKNWTNFMYGMHKNMLIRFISDEEMGVEEWKRRKFSIGDEEDVTRLRTCTTMYDTVLWITVPEQSNKITVWKRWVPPWEEEEEEGGVGLIFHYDMILLLFMHTVCSSLLMI